MRFVYSVVRFVPDPTRGECINLGLLLGSDQSGEWSLELVSRRDRARKIDERQILPGVVAELERLAGVLDAHNEPQEYLVAVDELPELSERWLQELADESRNVIQYSRPQPVIADSISDAVDKLWPLLIVEHEQAKRQVVTKHGIVSRFKQSLLRHKLDTDRIRQRATLKTPVSHSAIDFALHNGRVTHVAQCWSFQVQNREQILSDVKSWAWTIRDVRLNGGTVVGAGKELSVDKNVSVSVLYASPESGGREEWDEAVRVFEDDQVRAQHINFTDADRIAKEIVTAFHA